MLEKLEKYAVNHFPPKAMGFSPTDRLRIIIAEQLFQAYSSGRVPITRPPRKVVPIIAERVYRNILNNASTDPELAELRDACGIVEGLRRSYYEMTKDIAVYEAFRHIWGIDTSNHARAACEEGAYQLMEMGVTNGDPKALASGIDRLSNLHNNFQKPADDFADTAQTEIDFIADAKLVRPDAENFSREAIEEFKRKYGAFIDKEGGIEELIQNSEGVYESPAGDDDPDADKDYFETTDPIRIPKDQHPSSQ